MPYTVHSLIKDIMADEQAKMIVDRHVPGASTHPQLDEALYMTLGEVSMYPESGLNKAKLQALLDDLAKV
jgi:hypothetical protein